MVMSAAPLLVAAYLTAAAAERKLDGRPAFWGGVVDAVVLDQPGPRRRRVHRSRPVRGGPPPKSGRGDDHCPVDDGDHGDQGVDAADPGLLETGAWHIPSTIADGVVDIDQDRTFDAGQ